MMKKRNISLVLLFASLSPVFAQTLNIDLGGVIHSYPAEMTGVMEYSNGSEFTVMGKTYLLNDISRIFVTEEEYTDNLVTVSYEGFSAKAYISYNIIPYVEVSLSGAHVEVTQNSEVGDDTTGELNYRLNGESSDGSFLLNGSYKCSVELTGLVLNNPSGAAIDIENGKRIAVRVAEGTINSLSDGAGGSQKACLYTKGHLEFKQKGTLNVIGNQSHAIASKEYVEIKNTTINILGAVKDGINCAQYFLMESGNLNIKGTGDDAVQCDYKDSENREKEDTGTITMAGGNIEAIVTADAAKVFKAEGNFIITDGSITASVSGNGIWDETKQKTKASACISADENVLIDGGSINLTATGTGGKGISADGDYTGNSGSITILTTGGVVAYVNNTLQQNYTGNLDRLQSDLKSSPKGIKIDGDIDIFGGEYDVTTKGYNGEGIESKSNLTIAGGNIKIHAFDDGTNSSKDTYFKGGNMEIISTNEGDAIDSNGNIYISGGTIRCLASKVPEQGFDAGDGYNIYFTGGEFLAYGPGGNSVPKSSNQSTQAYLALSETVKGGDIISVSYNEETILSFEIPTEYTSSGNQGSPGGGPRSNETSSTEGTRAPGGWGGGGMGGSPLILSSPDLENGHSYTVTIGSTLTTATAKISN